jgi:hypothetical protein
MIDLDAVTGTREGSRSDKALAWLLGIAALTATVLAAIQVDRSLTEGRAQVRSAALVSEVTTQIAARDEREGFALRSAWRAVLGGAVGVGRQIVGLESGDEAEMARGDVEYGSSSDLVELATTMAAVPSPGGPLDPYVTSLLAATDEGVGARVAEQNDQADRAGEASSQGSLVVLGLSVVALAAVLAGLAAVLKDGRPGRVMLVAGFVATGVAIALGARAVI